MPTLLTKNKMHLKRLGGEMFLVMCSNCENDDESLINAENTINELQCKGEGIQGISHTICTKCAILLYPELYTENEVKEILGNDELLQEYYEKLRN